MWGTLGATWQPWFLISGITVTFPKNTTNERTSIIHCALEQPRTFGPSCVNSCIPNKCNHSGASFLITLRCSSVTPPSKLGVWKFSDWECIWGITSILKMILLFLELMLTRCWNLRSRAWSPSSWYNSVFFLSVQIKWQSWKVNWEFWRQKCYVCVRKKRDASELPVCSHRTRQPYSGPYTANITELTLGGDLSIMLHKVFCCKNQKTLKFWFAPALYQDLLLF